MNVREKLVELLGNIYLPIITGLNTIVEYTMCRSRVPNEVSQLTKKIVKLKNVDGVCTMDIFFSGVIK